MIKHFFLQQLEQLNDIIIDILDMSISAVYVLFSLVVCAN